MATYYVNSVVGSDITGAGSEELPWKEFQFGIEKLSDGDILIANIPPTSPSRGLFGMHCTKASGSSDISRITISGVSPTDKAYLIGSVDVSNGVSRGNIIPNGSFESWITTKNPYGWNVYPDGTDDILRSEIAASGMYSVRMYKSATVPAINMYFNLPANTAMTLSWQYRNSLATKNGRIILWDRTTGTYLAADGSWGASSIAPADSINIFAPGTVSFNTNSNGKYTLQLDVVDSFWAVYWDDISLVYDVDTINWTQHDGNTYVLDNKITNPYWVTKCSSGDWNTYGSAALRYVLKADDLADCIATPETWWYETNTLYYHLASGETINNVHLEVCRTGYDGSDSSLPTLAINHDYINIENVSVMNSAEAGINIAGDYSNVNDCNVENGTTHNILIDGEDAIINDTISQWSAQHDGYAVTGSAILNRCIANKNWDEGIECYGGGIIVANHCKSLCNGVNGDSGSEGFVSIGAGSSLTINHGVAYGNKGAGIGVMLEGTLIVKNSASHGNEFNDVRASADATLTADHNCYGTAYDQWNALGGEGTGTLAGTDPLWIDPANGDFRLLPTSPCRDAGVVIAGLTTDFEGKPVPMGSAPDIGAYEFPVPSPMGLTPGLGMGGRMIPPRRRRR